jgi:hypothetical protein
MWPASRLTRVKAPQLCRKNTRESTLGPTLAPPVPLADGGKDLYIKQADFHAQFAADVPIAQAAQMAVAQRPITEAALKEPSGTPAWKSIPSYFIYGSGDKNIPPAL